MRRRMEVHRCRLSRRAGGAARPRQLLHGGWLRRAIDIRPGELVAARWSWLYIFAVLSAYYVIRPIRDEMGVAWRRREPAMAVHRHAAGDARVNPPFAALVSACRASASSRWPIASSSLNLLVFVGADPGHQRRAHVWVGRAFFIWASVFNLFVVSVFWALMVDVFDTEQGKRLFGFLAAGATVGAIAGSSVTSGSRRGRPAYAAVRLRRPARARGAAAVGAALAARREPAPAPRRTARGEAPIGGGVLAGLTQRCARPTCSTSALLHAALSPSRRRSSISSRPHRRALRRPRRAHARSSRRSIWS